jgi:hypothetical protein
MKSKMPLEKPFDFTLSIDSIASASHAMLAYRTMFVKRSMSNHHTHSTCGGKGKSAKRSSHKNFNFIPTYHHCGGIENQVKTFSDQVKLINERLGSLTPNEKKSAIFNKSKNTTNKQVWIKKEDNLCLVAHTALKILDTCL